MKTKKLIELLQKADPTGEEDVSVGNCDIIDVYRDAAYWDGSQQVYEFDENGRIKGARYKRSGTKVVIYSRPLSDVLWDYPRLVVDYEDLPEPYKSNYKKYDDENRSAGEKCRRDFERQHFVEWAKKKAAELYSEIESVPELAREFFEANLSHGDPFPEDIKNLSHEETICGKVHTVYDSYNTRREKQWDREVDIVYEEMEFNIRKK